MLEHRPSLADRDDRTRDQDTAGADRLSEVTVLLCQPSRFVDRVLERASDVHAVGAEDPRATSASCSAGMARRVLFWVTTTSTSIGSKAASTPS